MITVNKFAPILLFYESFKKGNYKEMLVPSTQLAPKFGITLKKGFISNVCSKNKYATALGILFLEQTLVRGY